VRIVSRITERLVDSLLQLLRERVLEPIRFVVDVVDRQTERLGEVELQKAMVPDHLDSDALTRVGQLDTAIALVACERQRRELFHHRARRGIGDVQAPG
jgi:hypothetical protein